MHLAACTGYSVTMGDVLRGDEPFPQSMVLDIHTKMYKPLICGMRHGPEENNMKAPLSLFLLLLSLPLVEMYYLATSNHNQPGRASKSVLCSLAESVVKFGPHFPPK